MIPPSYSTTMEFENCCECLKN